MLSRVKVITGGKVINSLGEFSQKRTDPYHDVSACLFSDQNLTCPCLKAAMLKHWDIL